jgi:serine/threonine protein phosphatase PrpC
MARYGEDAVLATKTPDDVIILCMADGHGTQKGPGTHGHGQNGTIAVQSVHLYRDLTTKKPAMKEEDLFQAEQDKIALIEEMTIGHSGGATFSAAVIGVRNSRLFMTTTNLGDSPILLVDNKTGKMIRFSQSHVWENTEEYEHYLAYCRDKEITPMKAIYGTVNVHKEGVRIPHADGSYNPFPIFLDGTAIVNETIRDYFWRAVSRQFKTQPLGGCQTEHRYIRQVQNKDGTWSDHSPIPELAHQNWGATSLTEDGEGGIQLTRSLGDRIHKKHGVCAIPSITGYEFPPHLQDVTILVCSDGIGDRQFFHKLGELLHQKIVHDPSVDGQALSDHIIEYVMKGAGPDDKAFEHPTWDDLSVAVTRIIRKPLDRREKNEVSTP